MTLDAPTNEHNPAPSTVRPGRRRPAADQRATAKAPPTCAIYLRISLDADGDELGVTRQREDCQVIAERKGWRVVKVYVDNDLSGSKRSVVRPQYNLMVRDHQAGHFSHVIMYTLERLTRQPKQLEDWIERGETGRFLVTVSGDFDLSDPHGAMLARLLLAVAKGEVDISAKRHARALVQRTEQGRLFKRGNRPTGYTDDWQQVPAEVDIVRDIFAQFSAGNSLLGIATWLNDAGLQTIGKARRWESSSVRNILMNPTYAGINTGGVTLKGLTPLVDLALFESVVATLSDPRRRSQRLGTARRHLGSGLYLCWQCRHPVTSHSGDAYRCRDAHLTRGSKSVDKFVLASVAAYLAQPGIESLITPPDDQVAIDAGKAIASLNLRLAKHEAAFDDDLIEPADYTRKKRRIVADIEAATVARARATVTHLDFIVDDPKAAPGIFETAPIDVQRRIVGALTDVTLLPGKVGRPFDSATVVMPFDRLAAA